MRETLVLDQAKNSGQLWLGCRAIMMREVELRLHPSGRAIKD